MARAREDHDLRRGEHHRTQDAVRTLRGVIVGLLLAGLISLAIDNRREVRVGWVFGDGDAHLALVVVIAAVAGALLGWLTAHWPRHR